MKGAGKITSEMALTIFSFLFVCVQVLEEKCVFSQSEENKDWTQLERHVWVNSSLYGFSRALMAFGVERYKANLTKSNKGIQYIVDKLFVPEKVPDTLPHEVSKLRDNAKAKAQNMAARAGGMVQQSCLGLDLVVMSLQHERTWFGSRVLASKDLGIWDPVSSKSS